MKQNKNNRKQIRFFCYKRAKKINLIERVKMKLTIEIDEKSHLQSYLSILSIGILDCLEKKLISYDDAMHLLFLPSLIDRLEAFVPTLGEAIHLGTELEDVAELIPEKLKESIEQIRTINENSIQLKRDNKQHIFYNIK